MRIEWRPYTDPAPAGVPLWLQTQQGGIYRGTWTSGGGFKAEGMPLGVQVTGWAPREVGRWRDEQPS